MPEVADYVLSRLSEWGIHRIYGYPGDGINGFLGAFDRANGDPEIIQPRHEEMGAFMATAHAKFTGGVGCCIATSGGGAIHLLNGLYDAKLDHQSVLAIVGQQKRISVGAAFQQEIRPELLFTDVSDYVGYVMHPAQARSVIDRALKVAISQRGVATIIIPVDVQMEDAEPSPPFEHGAVYTSIGVTKPRIIPPETELRKAAEILNSGQKVAMLVGQGAVEAADEVVQAAELLGAGVAKTLLGRETLPDDLPFVTGPIGLLGSTASEKMMTDCDTLFMIGTSFPYSEWLPKEGQARGVEIDIDGRYIGIRYPMEANLVGDAKETLKALIPLLERKQDRSWRETVEKQVEEWWRILDDRAHDRADPVNPELVAYEFSPRIPDRAILTADSGSGTNWWAQYLKLRTGMQASLSGNLATMGAATPYAISAKLDQPDRPVIAFVGDGAFQMNGMAELITVKRYRDRLTAQNPTLVFCVFNNQDLNQVTWEQRAEAGDPKYPGTQYIPDVRYSQFAEILGLKGVFCDDPKRVGSAWDEALAADRPCVLEFKTDQEVPPIPPRIQKDLGMKSAKAMLKGDPEEAGVIVEGAKQELHKFAEKVREVLPGKKD
ncbi:thiamine pyrophosphate-requiring protein [Geodermatophilus sp. TF02-6]|uniref:thiamine pyrophosphate-requiring protein n=1 Tax=Geodermatophilus sp. TF02-6 TaxID=2250575 RepID=UPI000DE8CDCA|nr:thiamine pyrophosphate-requiring protein [Geodermatophilus sp. TF02-6]RBY82367.1 thiamine pyrophosphate-requiring protein [Geodermatophilus sp. TF02-6]